MNTIRLILGDSLIKLKELEDCSVDYIVSDPPYELTFMGKGWDGTGIAFSVELWGQCLRVLKPNGVIKAFSGTRTFHRMAKAMREAGFVDFEIHAWTYGSGFPKSMSISKALDKQAGAEREVVGRTKTPFKVDSAASKGRSLQGSVNGDFSKQIDDNGYRYTEHTAPATDAARQWSGWGTALKPAWEPIVVARKPS
jgi:site-specific DNA-methyltransferase (adenine-specific)